MAGKKKIKGKAAKKSAAPKKKKKVVSKKAKLKKAAPKKAARRKPAAKPKAAKKKAAAKPRVRKAKAKANARPKKEKVKAKAPAKKAKPPAKKKPPEKKPKPPPKRPKPAARKARAKAATLNAFFKPKSVAVIGASDAPGTPGRTAMDALLNGDFKGKLFPVCNKKTILDVKAYSTVKRVPGPVDLVIIPTKKEATRGIIQQCMGKKVKGVLMAAPVYGTGSAKHAAELEGLIEKSGFRLVGPDCDGLGNISHGLFMNFTGDDLELLPGNVALISQSGTIVRILLNHAADDGVGVGKFISLGGGVDVNENDCLEYWGGDKSVDCMLLCIGRFSDSHDFMEICSRVSREKPVLALKPSISTEGVQEEASGSRISVGIADKLIWEKCGVIACDGVAELFDIARTLDRMPIPAGNRVGIVANGTGLGTLALNSCLELDLAVPPLQPKFQSALAKALPKGAVVANPISVPESAGPAGYKQGLMALVKDPTVDIIIAIYTPQSEPDDMQVAKAIAKAWTDMRSKRKVPKPVYPVWMVDKPIEEEDPIELLLEKGLPVFGFPLEAIKVSKGLSWYRRWLEQPVGEVKRFTVDTGKAERIIAKAMSEKREYLDDAESQALLGCYGIPTVTTVVTGSLIAAKKHAAKMGYPLAVKGTSAGLVHRSELKAIYLDVGSEREMVSAYQKIDAQLSKRWGKPFRIMMQPMVKPGIDLTIGAMNHPGYDPILMFGLGGAFAESTEAVDFKLVPLTDLDARELVEGSIAYPVMKGGRGTAAVDADGLTEIILRFSRLIETHREIIAADLNPLRAFPGKRFVVIDQYFRLAR